MILTSCHRVNREQARSYLCSGCHTRCHIRGKQITSMTDNERKQFTVERFVYFSLCMPPSKLSLKAGMAGDRKKTASPHTCFSGSSMNSSVLETSTKCCRTYLCADLSRSLQECVSAKPLMPRQLEGSSWLRRNLQQASRTPLSCKRLAAGSNV